MLFLSAFILHTMLCHISHNVSLFQYLYQHEYCTICCMISIFARILHTMLCDIYLSKNIAHYYMGYFSQHENCTLCCVTFCLARLFYTLLCDISHSMNITHECVTFCSSRTLHTILHRAENNVKTESKEKGVFMSIEQNNSTLLSKS